MRWSPYAIPALVSVILLIFITVYLLKIKGDRRRDYLALTSVGFLVYSVGELLERLCDYGIVNGEYADYSIWLVSTKLMGAGILMSMTFLVIFFLHFPTKIEGWGPFNVRILKILMYAFSALVLYFILFTDLVIGTVPDIYKIEGVGYGQHLGPAMKYLAIMMTAIFLLVGFRLFQGYRRGDQWRKAQIRLLAIGMGIFIVVTLLTSVIPWILSIEVYPLSTVFIPFPIFFTAYAIKKYRLFSFKAREEKSEELDRYVKIAEGKSYLFFERRPYLSLTSFRKFVENHRGLVVSTFPPMVLKENFRFENTPFLWLSEESYDTYSCSPYRLDFEISNSIIEFMKARGVAVYIDSLHYLRAIYPMEKLLEFVKLLVDVASETESTIIVSANPSGFTLQERELLKALFDENIAVSSSESFKKFGSALYLSSRDEMLLREKCTVVVSVINPKKIREKCNAKRVHWISNLDVENTIKPDRIEFDLLDALYTDLRELQKGTACICDLEYVLKFNSLEKIMEILKKARDAFVIEGWQFIVQINPKVVDSDTIHILSSLFESEVYVDEEVVTKKARDK